MTTPFEEQVNVYIHAIASTSQVFSEYDYEGGALKLLPPTSIPPSSASSPPPSPESLASTTQILAKPTSRPSTTSSPNPLSLASDTFSLLKAYTTKLGLLAINTPFSPTAITPILLSLQKDLLPPLILAESCPASTWTSYLHAALQALARGAFFELRILLTLLPTSAADLASDALATRSPRVLRSVGIIHGACDRALHLAANGIGEYAAQKAADWYELMQDACSELEEWKTEGMQQTEDEDTFGTDTSDDDGLDNEAHFSGDEGMTLPKAILPRADVPTQVAAYTTAAGAFLEHMQKIYPPLIKRRLKRFPALTRTISSPTPSEEQCRAFDIIVFKAEQLPGEVDDLVAALYLWDIGTARAIIGAIREKAVALADAIREGGIEEGKGKGKEDKVGEWVRQWGDMVARWEFGDENGQGS